MQLDFFAVIEDASTIKLFDVSQINETLPTTIYSMTLDVISSKMTNGRLDNKLDVIAYLRNQRIQTEIYTLTSDILGFGENVVIPDGVYHIYYDINNSVLKEHTFLIYRNVEEKVNFLLEQVNYGVEVNNYDYEFVGDYSDYDLEKVRLCVSLLDNLKTQAQEPNEVDVNDTLDKLERLLEIINTDINN